MNSHRAHAKPSSIPAPRSRRGGSSAPPKSGAQSATPKMPQSAPLPREVRAEQVIQETAAKASSPLGDAPNGTSPGSVAPTKPPSTPAGAPGGPGSAEAKEIAEKLAPTTTPRSPLAVKAEETENLSHLQQPSPAASVGPTTGLPAETEAAQARPNPNLKQPGWRPPLPYWGQR